MRHGRILASRKRSRQQAFETNGLKPGAFDPSNIYVSTQLLIDPSSGLYPGERTASLHAYGVVPAGAELSSTAMRTDVVTSLGDWVIPAGDRMFVSP